MKYVITSIISAIAGAAILYWYMPQNSAETITKDRIITVTRTVKSPDGTVITDERKEENSTTKEKVITADKSPDWHISIGSDINRIIKLEVSRRILGPITIGVYGDTNKTIGVGVGILF